jgi:hypothetical protein
MRPPRQSNVPKATHRRTMMRRNSGAAREPQSVVRLDPSRLMNTGLQVASWPGAQFRDWRRAPGEQLHEAALPCRHLHRRHRAWFCEPRCRGQDDWRVKTRKPCPQGTHIKGRRQMTDGPPGKNALGKAMPSSPGARWDPAASVDRCGVKTPVPQRGTILTLPTNPQRPGAQLIARR